MTGFERPLDKTAAKQLNPVVLAFVGDAVYSLYVRSRLVCSGEGRASEFQRAASRIVSAKGQSDFLETLLPRLTEEEAELYRRGRNAKKATKSKNASAVDYNRSTGFETVLGFLYLTGDEGRIEELLSSLDGSLFCGEKAATAYKP
ncbi:MAG: Mini-ribonuclease 3 [Clostridia bacterium]|nr:Mini-ribonuclease 3 [Clostridia bacterium]